MNRLSQPFRRLRLNNPRLQAIGLALGATLSLAGCGGGDAKSGSDVAAAGAENGPNATAQAAKPKVTTAAPVATATAETTGGTTYTGRGWFVDSATGSDTAAGTAAAPWKTLARAATQKLGANDAVLLKCGGIWRESFTLNATNAPAGGGVLGAWGSCTSSNRPVISGADVVSGTWSVASGMGDKPVYVTSWTKAVSALYWNGTPLTRARYPNHGGVGREFSLISAMRDARTLKPDAAIAAALGSVSLTGAKAFIRTNPWLVESHDIASSDSTGAITLKGLATYAPQAGQGFFVEGKLALLDVAGEWYHDATTGQLFVWTPNGQSPTTGVLESAQRPVGVKVSKIAGARVDNITFERQTGQAIYIVDAQRTAVTEVTSRDAGSTAILIEGTSTGRSNGSTVDRATITNAGTMGIDAASVGVRVADSVIEGTGMGPSGSGVSAGVYIRSVGGVVKDNRITNSAFAAIIPGNATGLTISGNTLTQACKRFTDCGAIYSGGAPSAAQRSTIVSNVISDMVPNPEGAVGGATTLVAGIYLDEASSTHDVTNNMISRTGVGINLHNSSNHSVQLNRVWLTDRASIRLHNSSPTETVRGNVIQDNELFASVHLEASTPATTAPTTRQVYAQEWVHGSNAALMFTGVNPNVSRRNVTATMSQPALVRWSLLSGWTHQTLDAAQWGAYGTSETTKAAYAARPFVVTSGGANLVQDSLLQTAGVSWLFWSPTPAAGGKMTYSTCGTSGCADFAPGSTSDFLMSNTFQMSSATGSNLYHLRVRAQALVAGANLTMAINRAGGDWAQLGLVLMSQPIDNAVETSVDALFNATSSDVARLNLTGLAGKSVRLRDVTVAQVGAYELMAPSRESTLLSNETAVAKSIACPSTLLRTCVVSDLAGQPVTWPVTLAPNTSKVVVSADAKWKP